MSKETAKYFPNGFIFRKSTSICFFCNCFAETTVAVWVCLLGWLVVLVGAVVMRFTNFALMDPIMSIGVSLFILINAIRNLKEVADLFLEKAPHNVEVAEIKEHIQEIDGVLNIHHIHIWSMDGQNKPKVKSCTNTKKSP